MQNYLIESASLSCDAASFLKIDFQSGSHSACTSCTDAPLAISKNIIFLIRVLSILNLSQFENTKCVQPHSHAKGAPKKVPLYSRIEYNNLFNVEVFAQSSKPEARVENARETKNTKQDNIQIQPGLKAKLPLINL